MPGLDELTQLKAEKLKLKKQLLLSKLAKDSPTLFWAMAYHIDTAGSPLEFKDVPYLIDLYRNIHKWEQFVAIKAVQVGITEMLFLNNLREASEGMSVFYVFPKYELRNRFVSNRVVRAIKRVPFYKDKTKEAQEFGGTERMSLIHFGLGGIAFVGSNVENEFLEIPVDSATIDELDRCHQQNLLLVPDRLKHSNYKYLRQVSNPTTEGYGIDALYNESSKGKWFLTCEHCRHRFAPEFFSHVIEQTGLHSYQAKDKAFREGTVKDARILCEKCGKPVDRLAIGEWVFEEPSNPVVGIRLHQLVSPRTTMDALIREWKKAVGNKIKEQRFYNMNLGLAFNAKGAKIQSWELDKCRRPYQMLVAPMQGGFKIMGVDVGNPLYYVIRERTSENGVQVLRLLNAGTCLDFEQLAKKIRDWSPRMVVVDADPEGHQVSRLKRYFGNVWSCRFQEGLVEPNKNKEDRHITVDRTSLLDTLPASIDAGTFLLPGELDDNFKENFLEGEYYKQMMASTRMFEENEVRPDKSKFIWFEGQREDHYFLAEGYCLLADSLLPDSSLILGYYQREVENAERSGGLTVPLEKGSVKNAFDYMNEVNQMNITEEGKAKLLDSVSQSTLMATKSRQWDGVPLPHRTEEEIEAEMDKAIFSVLSKDATIADVPLISRTTGLAPLKIGMYLTKIGWQKIDTLHFRRPGF